MDTIGVGVIGCGFVGYGAHVPAFKTIEGSRLVAVADADAKRRDKVAQKYQVKAYAEYSDLVHDPEIQAVVVAVPTPLHAEVALAAIEVYSPDATTQASRPPNTNTVIPVTTCELLGLPDLHQRTKCSQLLVSRSYPLLPRELTAL